MTDIGDRANDLVAKYESQLTPSAEEHAKSEEFFNEINMLLAREESGEINSEELVNKLKELREKSKASAVRALGGLVSEPRFSSDPPHMNESYHNFYDSSITHEEERPAEEDRGIDFGDPLDDPQKVDTEK